MYKHKTLSINQTIISGSKQIHQQLHKGIVVDRIIIMKHCLNFLIKNNKPYLFDQISKIEINNNLS